jgi:osmotically-inducible protein OsmY
MKTDQEIQNDVMDELKWEPFLTASEIGVAVKNGIVTLSGTVDRYAKKIAAETAAKKVNGVKAVAEDIEVKLGTSSKKNDTEIAEAAIIALKWHSAMQENKINISVENGWVTLEGDVDWEFQRNSAKYMVENLIGVVGITNNIKIKTVVASTDVKRKIASAFHRSATVDSEKINITLEGPKVILSGKVRSFAEKKDAENAAWLAPGVNSIENKLEIDSEVLTY